MHLLSSHFQQKILTFKLIFQELNQYAETIIGTYFPVMNMVCSDIILLYVGLVEKRCIHTEKCVCNEDLTYFYIYFLYPRNLNCK